MIERDTGNQLSFKIHHPFARKCERFWRQRFRKAGDVPLDQRLNVSLLRLIRKLPDYSRDMWSLSIAERLKGDALAGTLTPTWWIKMIATCFVPYTVSSLTAAMTAMEQRQLVE